MEHLGELLSLFVAVLWTATALFADVASHRLGAMTVNIIRLTLATVFIAITLMFTIGAPYPLYAGRQAWLWLGLSALVEAHDEEEIKLAVECGARIIGVNNRNLTDFSVDTDNSLRLRRLVPEGVAFVSESGFRGRMDVVRASEAGADAVLVGEALMRAESTTEKIGEMRGDL